MCFSAFHVNCQKKPTHILLHHSTTPLSGQHSSSSDNPSNHNCLDSAFHSNCKKLPTRILLHHYTTPLSVKRNHPNFLIFILLPSCLRRLLFPLLFLPSLLLFPHPPPHPEFVPGATNLWRVLRICTMWYENILAREQREPRSRNVFFLSQALSDQSLG